jgi:TPM domain
MNPFTPPIQRRASIRRIAPGMHHCPACRGPLRADTKRCPSCEFSGPDSLALFPNTPPPLLPILDIAELFSPTDLGKIEVARERLHRRFPQFHWRLCTVYLPPETRPSLFGFWLLNTSPLLGEETHADRAWTVLLLVDASSSQATIVPGYAAEPYLADDEWRSVLTTMVPHWAEKKPAQAVAQFFKMVHCHLEKIWSHSGERRSSRTIFG